MEAFARGESARANKNPFKKYDYKKAIERINEVKPNTASLGISEDWGCTAYEVYTNGMFIIDLTESPNIAGIDGSIGGTPTLELDGEQEDCWIFE